jgi:hypothetical protein
VQGVKGLSNVEVVFGCGEKNVHAKPTAIKQMAMAAARFNQTLEYA